MLTGHEVRRAFIGYFKRNHHEHIPSGRLTPENDDTLLFTNAGMNQFKNIFLGLEDRPYKRAVTVQKCVRAGGKHNDLENVGWTARHLTFFEMLGNFSFGDYFKRDAIRFAWEFLTDELKLPKEKLHVTVFREDDEAAEIWNKQEGVPHEKIFRFDEKDNFWMMGDTGPCGPCSEIFYDHGPAAGCGKAGCKVGCSCDRFVEIWNLVFMQYNMLPGGKRENLPKPSVDTGAGLERLTAVMQGTNNNFSTDLFLPLVNLAKSLEKDSKYDDVQKLAACRVLADHARTSAFLIADGVLPSNEGRGYVLRRIMRRAIRYGRKLNSHEPLLLPVVKNVIETMGLTYYELPTQTKFIENAVAAEESKFLETLDLGTHLLNEEIVRIRAKGESKISGEVLFKLYDTYGFPVDLSRVIAVENSFDIDQIEFERLMARAKEQSKSSWKGHGIENHEAHFIKLSQKFKATEFLGYTSTNCQATALTLSDGTKELDQLGAGQEGYLIVDRSVFYGESGGQVGDRGGIKWLDGKKECTAEIADCKKVGEIFLHRINKFNGPLKIKTPVTLIVDASTRRATARNHSATHLMHAALKQVLGAHVTQSGSLVSSDRLRFDFNHSQGLTATEIENIEDLVNHEIVMARQVTHSEMNIKEAQKLGAVALFGEKYGKVVRVIQMGEFSTELCGGTHVSNTSEIQYFKIVSESSVSSGVRRIEGLTSQSALAYLSLHANANLKIQHLLGLNSHWSKQLQGGAGETVKQVGELLQSIKQLEKQLKLAKKSNFDISEATTKAKRIGNFHYLICEIDIEDKDLVRELSDKLRDNLSPAVVVLFSPSTDGVSILVSVSKEIGTRLHAGKLLQTVASTMGGRGGGKPDFAQGAGKDSSQIKQAIAIAEREISGALG